MEAERKGSAQAVLVCGDSPVAFLLVALLRSKGCIVNVYSRSHRWTQNWPVRVMMNGSVMASGKASLVSSDPSQVCRVSMVLIATPPSKHEQVLSEIVPHLPGPAWVVMIGGGWWQRPQGLHSRATFACLSAAPWICTTKDCGSLQQLECATAGLPIPKLETSVKELTIHVLSTSPVPLGVVPPKGRNGMVAVVRDKLSQLLDVKLELADLLACALDPYCVFGPTVVFSALKNWNGIAFAEPPTLEELGVIDVPLVSRLEEMADELYTVQSRIQAACADYTPSKSLLQRMRDSSEVMDGTSVRSCVFNHRTLNKLVLPCDRITDASGQSVYLPQCLGQRDATSPVPTLEEEEEPMFLNLEEDITYGLLMCHTIGQKLEPPVNMPRCQEVLEWSQRQLKKEWIGKAGQAKPTGRRRDLSYTRCPADSMEIGDFLGAALAGSMKVREKLRHRPPPANFKVRFWPRAEDGAVEFKGSLYATMLMLFIAMSWLVCASCAIIASWHGISMVEVLLLFNAFAWLFNSCFIHTQSESTLYRMKLWDIVQAATTLAYSFFWMWGLEYMSLANVATMLLGSPIVTSVLSAVKRHRQLQEDEEREWFSLLSWRLWVCVLAFVVGAACLSLEEEQEGELTAVIGVLLCCTAMWVAGASHYFVRMHQSQEADPLALPVPVAVRANGEFIVAMVISGFFVLITGSLSLPILPETWLSLIVGGASLFVGGVAIAKCSELSGVEMSTPSPLYLSPPLPSYNALFTSCFAVFLSFIFTYTAFSPHHHFGAHDAWSIVAVILILAGSVYVVHQEVLMVEAAQTDIPGVPYDFPARGAERLVTKTDSDDETTEYYDP